MYDYGVQSRAVSAWCMPAHPRPVDAFPRRLPSVDALRLPSVDAFLRRLPSPLRDRMVYNRAKPTGQNVLPSVPGDTICVLQIS